MNLMLDELGGKKLGQHQQEVFQVNEEQLRYV